MRRPINSVNGTYKDPNRQYSAQDALNVIPMMAEKSGTRTLSKYVDAPGLKPFCRIGTNDGETFTAAGAGRGMRVVDGKLYAVAGRNLWQITAAGVSVNYGTIPGVGRVSMAHNQRGLGNELAIDNGQSRYIFNTQTQDLGKVTDESFPGSVKAFFIDGYIGYVEPGGRYWGHSDLSNALVYNAFDVYEAEGQPDRIVSAHVSNREVLIAGQDSIEAYVNAPSGSGEAPFVRATNTVIPSGCSARDSFCNVGQFTVYLDQNRTVQVLNGYTPVPISTSVIDAALQECTKQQIANAYAFSLEAEGFQIYYLTVPGKFTFGYDFKNREWHRRSSTGLAWWAVTDVVRWNGKWYALDSRRGDILELRWKDYPFDVQEELVREWVTGVVSADQNPVFIHELEFLFGCGGKEYTPIGFAEQPVGPQISGQAPDSTTLDAYSFTYTLTPGDAPIARVKLLDTTLPPGWVWDQTTATISYPTTPVPVSTVSLRMRVFDENGLYADHEDDFVVALDSQLLIAGSNGVGEPFFAASSALEIDWEAIPQSTGADLINTIPGRLGDTWLALGDSELLYSVDLVTWSSVALPWSGDTPRRVVGGADGWLLLNSEFSGEGAYAKASETPTDVASYTFSLGGTPRPTLSQVWFVKGYYYAELPGGGAGTLCRSATLDGGWELVCTKDTSIPGSSAGSSILFFLDIIEHKGDLYAAVIRSFSGQRPQIRKSGDEGFTWPTVVVDTTDAGHTPYQLASDGDDLLVALTWGSDFVYTSADEYEVAHETGVKTNRALTVSNENKGRQIVFASGRFHIVSGSCTETSKADRYVNTIDGTEFSTPVLLPLSAIRGIATSFEVPSE